MLWSAHAGMLLATGDIRLVTLFFEKGCGGNMPSSYDFVGAELPPLQARDWNRLRADLDRGVLMAEAIILREVCVARHGPEGAAFVTDRGTFPSTDWYGWKREKGIYVNGKFVVGVVWSRTEVKLIKREFLPGFRGWPRPINEEMKWARDDEDRDLRTPPREVLRKKAWREFQAAYDQERELLISDMADHGHVERAPFGKWEYRDGEKGGYFFQKGKKWAVYVGATDKLLQAARARLMQRRVQQLKDGWT